METCGTGASQHSECKTPTSEGEDLRSDEGLLLFIETYKSLQELWDPLHPSYTNKTQRNLALDKLITIYRRIKPGANRDDVRKKINTLRSNYRKELNKILTSKVSGCGIDEVYKPTSWVFHALKFLNNCEYQAPHDEEHQTRRTRQAVEQADRKSLLEEQLQKPPTPSGLSIIPIAPTVKKQRLVGQIAKEDKMLSLVCKLLQQPKAPEDNGPTIAKVWGEKLADLDPLQRVFAEKAINDVLFEASLGNLHRYSVKINEDEQNCLVQSFTSTFEEK